MVSATIVEMIEEKFEALRDALDERSRRLWVATEAMAVGHGGVSAVSRATGLAESTIRAGRRELKEDVKRDSVSSLDHRVRRRGGGRKRLTEHDPKLVKALDALVDPTSRGSPTSPLRWTCKSIQNWRRN